MKYEIGPPLRNGVDGRHCVRRELAKQVPPLVCNHSRADVITLTGAKPMHLQRAGLGYRMLCTKDVTRSFDQ